ncbi:hypothetical protein [Clostridium magnum]|uniref:SbsA Ig-like domain-containing protein n=1 Tax=Clostridium magnum DSM 2767 TaxID=1121326 RepID=A0A161X3Q1_9CLOT|nr:hypothetical protein [Clostridium magnum]KZL94128.1 hypothetical protein CLMAG_11810 [Clostridium magnum DSM 2767]SHH94534.1 hypothetical protein SAMN02745944_01872 [Clostridium magnum DSM 2767]
MKLKYKKLIAFIAVISTVQFGAFSIINPNSINYNTVYAASSQTEDKVITQKITTDTNKAWTINFNTEIDFNSVKDSIQVNKVSNGQLGTTVPVTVFQRTKSSIIVTPPSGGYEKGQMYQITVKKGAKATTKKGLYRNNIMKFSVTSDNAAIGKVEVSPVVKAFKLITVNATSRSDIKKYKIEGNEKLFNIGETSLNVLENKSSVKVYFYGDDRYTLLGSATVDVSKSASDIQFQIK